ncbi:hypothetical protein GCM10027060_26420 [Nesterenkonia halophila]
MPLTVAPPAPKRQGTQPRHAAFTAVFHAHVGVSWWRVAPTKTAPPRSVADADLHQFEFMTPPSCVGAMLVVDIDRDMAVSEVHETIPAEIRPSWMVETRRGAQAGWLIDPVDLRDSARQHPIDYARAVGYALRAAVDGDEAVDPLTPSRVRNPAYAGAELRAPATPPTYRLGELRRALADAGLWQQPTPRDTSPRRGRGLALAQQQTGSISMGSRNIAVFDATRYAAYAGRDIEAAAWAAADRCDVPLPVSEVRGIIRSVRRYVTRGQTPRAGSAGLPDRLRQVLSDRGRRGGTRGSVAQRAARALGPVAAAAARRARTDRLAATAQRLRRRGHTLAVIAEKLGTSVATASRWCRRIILTHEPACTTGASGDASVPGPLPEVPHATVATGWAGIMSAWNRTRSAGSTPPSRPPSSMKLSARRT